MQVILCPVPLSHWQKSGEHDPSGKKPSSEQVCLEQDPAWTRVNPDRRTRKKDSFVVWTDSEVMHIVRLL